MIINWYIFVKGAKSVEWLGHCLSEDGIKPTDKKADQIRALKHPICLKELRHVISIFNDYGRYIKNMADIAPPIYERNRNYKNKAFIWGDKEQLALETIKSEIYKQNVLVTFNTDRECETILTCDASELGMGAMLEQQQTDCTVRPVIYWSSTFRSYEKNYSISEKYALACVAAINKFRIYIFVRTVFHASD